MKSKTALLITSAQHDLLHPGGGAWGLVGGTVNKNQVVAKLERLATAARAAGIPVLHSPVELDYAAMGDFKPLSVIQKVIIESKLLAKGTPGARFVPELEPKPGDITLKPRQGFSSFWRGDLGGHLKALGVETIYIAGMLANACVESHTRDAVENGYRPVVIRDATAAPGDEVLQAALTILSLHASALVTTDEAIASWRTAYQTS